MKKLDWTVFTVAIQEATLERDRVVRLDAEYRIVDAQDPGISKTGRLDVSDLLDKVEPLLFAAYGRINEKEGTSFDQGGQPLDKPLTEDELAALHCYKNRLREWPTPFAYMEADFEARVNGDETKRLELDKKFAEVNKKYPMPGAIPPTTWQRVKAFFGY